MPNFKFKVHTVVAHVYYLFTINSWHNTRFWYFTMNTILFNSGLCICKYSYFANYHIKKPGGGGGDGEASSSYLGRWLLLLLLFLLLKDPAGLELEFLLMSVTVVLLSVPLFGDWCSVSPRLAMELDLRVPGTSVPVGGACGGEYGGGGLSPLLGGGHLSSWVEQLKKRTLLILFKHYVNEYF